MHQGYHLPIGLVGTEDDVLHSRAVLLARQFLGILRYFVVSAYLAAHVERLRQGDGSGKEVSRVCTQGIHQRVVVERRGNVYGGERLYNLHELLILQQARILGNESLHAVLHRPAQLRAYASQGFFLFVAQQGYFFLCADVSKGCFPLMACGFHLLAAYQQFLVVGHGQRAATVKRQRLLRFSRTDRPNQQRTCYKCFFCNHRISFLFLRINNVAKIKKFCLF